VSDYPRDYFDKARTWAAIGLVLAGALLILGSFLDWVKIDRLPDTIPSDQVRFAQPFNGFDVGDGYIIGSVGVLLGLLAVGMFVSSKSRYAWGAFFGCMVAGAVAISDYRDIDGLFRQEGTIGGGISAGIGLTVCALGALIGVISAVTGVAATPRRN
jgi:hypothetical protein